MKTLVKICGITRVEDAQAAQQCGVDFIGVIVDIEESPRAVSVETAGAIIAGSPVPVVLLLEKPQEEIVKITKELKPFAVQLIGDYACRTLQNLKAKGVARIWKTYHLPKDERDNLALGDACEVLATYRASGVDVVVFDTMVIQGNTRKKGGTGEVCDWRLAGKLVARVRMPIFLAGGISPVNASEAINVVHPYGIDLSSGVEIAPGIKDAKKIAALMQIVNKTNGCF